MKPTSGLSGLPLRAGAFFLFIAVALLLPAQEAGDSLDLLRDRMPELPQSSVQPALPGLAPVKNEVPFSYPLSPPADYLPVFSMKEELHLPYQTNPSPLLRGDYRTGGVLRQFRRGMLLGSGGQTSLPGIGRFNDASLRYRHAFSSKLAFELGATALKINMPHIAGQAFSASGALLYRPSEGVAFKVFGSYDIGNPYGMSTHRYGATVAVDLSERFNLEMGVQRYYDAMRGRWETVPVVVPSYRFDKFTLGFDVGGLLYQILREFVFDKERSNPTIGPPRAPIRIR